MRSLFLSLLLVLLIPVGAGPLGAQETSEYLAKVILMEKIVAYVEWPSTPSAEGSRPFVLGVVGRTPFGDELDAHFRSRNLKGRPVQIRYFRSAEDVGDCDLLFVCASERERLGAVMAKTKARPVLTMGDTTGYARGGVMVNLVREGSRLVFEVNVARAKESGLRMASGFLKLAKTIE